MLIVSMNKRLSVGVAVGALVLAACADGTESDSAASTSPTIAATIERTVTTERPDSTRATERPDSTSTSAARSTPPPTTDARRRRRAARVPTTSVVYDLAVPADCVIRRPVQLGSSGEDVVCLQTRLSEVTPGGGDLGADGDFGPATDAAVREFQAAQGLVVDGIVGAQTAELLAVWDPAPAPTAGTSPPPAPTAGTSPPLPAVDLGTDPRFGTCAEAQQNGNTPYERGVDPEYEFYDDRDDDGIVCE